MGWKNIKAYFKIGHLVQVVDGQLLIGSVFVPDGLVYCLTTGRRVRRASVPTSLTLVAEAMDAAPEQLLELWQTPDSFSASIPVFTYQGSQIIEQACEEPGFPNVTHAGTMMYENTHSTNRDDVVRWALSSAQAGIRVGQRMLAQNERERAEIARGLHDDMAALHELEVLYPQLVSDTLASSQGAT